MQRVKTFEFEVSNTSSAPCSSDIGTQWYQIEQRKLRLAEDIDDAINNFLKDKSMISMHVSAVDVHYHNNARGNTIRLYYTIVFEK